MRLGEDLGVGRVVDLTVERDHLTPRGTQRGQGVAIGASGRDLLALVPARQLERPRGLEPVRLSASVRLRHVDDDVANAAELLDRLVGVVERLAVPALLVLDLLDALSLD